MNAAFDNKQSDDEACGRLLDVYVQEAERYDTGLVQSWKDDMDNTLVFAGLYSGILTAFVIESYSKLQEDPADASVVLLQRISEQLTSPNGSDSTAQAATDGFKPTSAAVACNILWFLSLILALFCAFLATFVQQWSRQFLHKTGQLRSPTPHARLLSFLYFGLKAFNMHTVVNVIPSMLHLSFFLFLGGLIAFLQDVNSVLAYIVVGALAIVTAVYASFTIWPLIALNCPYQTPLSPIVWRVWQGLARTVISPAKTLSKKLQSRVSRIIIYATHAIHFPTLPTAHHSPQPSPTWHRIKSLISSPYTFLRTFHNHFAAHTSPGPYSKNVYTLSDAVMVVSQKSDQRRDIQCMTWAISSLTDDQELLPFVEALPDTIYGPDGIRDSNIHLIKALVETAEPQADIILRIISLMTNASSSWFDEKHRTRCSIACPKALWALAYLFAERPAQFDLEKVPREFWFPEHLLEALRDGSRGGSGNSLDRKHAVSALALCSMDVFIDTIWAGRAIRHFLQTSKEFEPFEFERSSSVLSKCLSGDLGPNNRSFLLGLLLSNPSLDDHSIVPQIGKENPLAERQVARFDVAIALCLQVPELPDGDLALVVEFIHKRAELDGWGSTRRIWQTCTTPRGLNKCDVDRRSCMALREYIYAQLPSDPNHTTHAEKILPVCARILGEHLDPKHQVDHESDTAQLALETMVAMGVVLNDPPEGTVEISNDFDFVRRYVQQNVLRLGEKSWSGDGPFDGEDVKASRVVILTTRLLKRFLSSTDDSIVTNDILDAFEFILFISYQHELFDRWHPEVGSRAISGELADVFSQTTVDICQWWMETPSEALSRNALDIIVWAWVVLGGLKLSQSHARQNLAQAATWMLSPESTQKVEECRSKEPNRVPARCTAVNDFLRWSDHVPLAHLEAILRKYSEVGDAESVSWETMSF